jgi:hypothetical protein
MINRLLRTVRYAARLVCLGCCYVPLGNAARRAPVSTVRNALRRAALEGGGSGGRSLPPACWPPGSPEGSWCRHGAMPGRQGRMSGTPPPRRSPRRSHSPLTACSGPRRAGHGRWRGRGRAFGACCFAGKLRSPAGPGPAPPWPRRLDPTSFPTSIPTAFPAPPMAYPAHPACPHLRWSCPLVGPVGRKNRGRLAPLRGSGAAAPSGCASRD